MYRLLGWPESRRAARSHRQETADSCSHSHLPTRAGRRHSSRPRRILQQKTLQSPRLKTTCSFGRLSSASVKPVTKTNSATPSCFGYTGGVHCPACHGATCPQTISARPAAFSQSANGSRRCDIGPVLHFDCTRTLHRQPPDQPSRVTGDHRARRNWRRYDAARRDHTAAPRARHQDRALANPCVRADRDASELRRVGRTPSSRRQQFVMSPTAQQAHSTADQRVLLNDRRANERVNPI